MSEEAEAERRYLRAEANGLTCVQNPEPRCKRYDRTYYLATKSKAFTGEDLMPFGKHANQPMREVPADYLLYLWSKNVDHGGVHGYIRANLQGLLALAPQWRATISAMTAATTAGKTATNQP